MYHIKPFFFFFFFFFFISFICLFIYIYILRQAKKEAKNLTLVRQTLEMTELIHNMHTRLDFVSNMGGIPTGYTSSHGCVKPKSNKKYIISK